MLTIWLAVSISDNEQVKAAGKNYVYILNMYMYVYR